MDPYMSVLGDDADWTEDDQRYFEKVKAYRDRFGSSVPREMLPPYVTDADVIRAIDICLEQDRDILLELLEAFESEDDSVI